MATHTPDPPRRRAPDCRCGSHEPTYALYNERRQFMTFGCSQCEKAVLERYEPKVVDDAKQWASEHME